jgi:hypothetical protein
MVIVLKELCRVFFSDCFHASHQQASGLEDFEVISSEFNTGFSKRIHDFSTETFSVRVRAEFHPVAGAFKNSASLVWGYVYDGGFLHDNHKNRFCLVY